MPKLLLPFLGASGSVLLLAHCGGSPVSMAPPDLTPIGDAVKFAGVCVVLAVLVAALASLVSGTSSGDPPST